MRVTMVELEELLKKEKNRKRIAELIYHRYYERYLKIFFYKDKDTKKHQVIDDIGIENEESKSIFNTEYKNGFSIMANCCILIETLSSFFDGINETPWGKTERSFKKIFAQAKEYGNEIKVFEESDFYNAIRNGLLHQGETKKSFKIRRKGELFENKIINATKFCQCLKEFLLEYTKRLSESERWDGEMWDKCRLKLRYIINNC